MDIYFEESSTYEVFERDPVKYAEYQNAMLAAITDMVPPEEKDTRVRSTANTRVKKKVILVLITLF